MGTKVHPAPNDCYERALPDEPLFTLLARDPAAPGLIDYWAAIRELGIEDGSRPESDKAIVAEARQCAKDMRKWRDDNYGKWRK